MRLLSLLGALLLAGVAVAQDPLSPLGTPGGPAQRPAPVFEYALAFIAAACVLVVVCYPARRS